MQDVGVYMSTAKECYESLMYFWASSLEQITDQYRLNYSESEMVAKALGNYTFSYYYHHNKRAYKYARDTLGQDIAIKQFNQWSMGNSSLELSDSEIQVCHRLVNKGIFEILHDEGDYFFDLSPKVFDALQIEFKLKPQETHFIH